jgi:hypothetical protein
MPENWMDYKVGQEVYIDRWGKSQAEVKAEKSNTASGLFFLQGKFFLGQGHEKLKTLGADISF